MGARPGRHASRSKALLADRSGGEFRQRACPSRSRVPVVSSRRRCTRLAAATGSQISMVWSAPESLALELLAKTGGALAERVASTGAHALGALSTITAPASFPLSLLRLPSVTASRLALVGDAAPACILCGPGSQSRFRDAAVLSSILAGPAVRCAIRDRRCCSSAMRGSDSRPVLAMQESPMGWCACLAHARRGWACCEIAA